jgi:hypothetical protein
MTESEYAQRQTELDRLLNDPDVPMQAALVWQLLEQLAARRGENFSNG